MPGLRVLTAALFWIVNLWWLGHLVQAIRYAPGGSFRIYSVTNNGVEHLAWGLTFTGWSGLALAVAYFCLVVAALIGSVIARGRIWMVSALILLAWSMLFSGNSILLSRWTAFQWWDWVNLGGTMIVIAHLIWTWRRHLHRGHSRYR